MTNYLTPKMRMYKTAIVYYGKSAIDQTQNILVGITGLQGTSVNRKTGVMAQLTIIPDPELYNPIEASRILEVNKSICGECNLQYNPITKKKPCYVNLGHEPIKLYQSYHKGLPTISPEQLNQLLIERDLPIRLGNYGDPGSIPIEIIKTITKHVKYTSYTHAFTLPTFNSEHLKYSMLSIDYSNYDQAKKLFPNARSYRMINKVSELQDNEILCPSKQIPGYKWNSITCSQCLLCSGSSKIAKNIAIIAA